MDEAGVAKSAIVQASTAYGHDNSYVAEAIAAPPPRFTGVFSIDMLAPDDGDKIEHWIARGFSGMRLFTTGSTMPGQATWFDDPATLSWEYAAAAKFPVCMQMTPQGFPQLRRMMGVSQGEDHPRPSGAADARRRSAVCRRRRLLRAREVQAGLSQDDAGQRRTQEWGKATPETFFGG